MGKLSDKAVQAAQPHDKQYGISDGNGLTLIVKPNGSKLWWFRYRFAGKARTLSIGEYPFVSLKKAREISFEAKQSLTSNTDPSAAKKEAKSALRQVHEKLAFDASSKFEAVSREWFEKFSKSSNWVASHSSKVIARLENDIFPWLGERPVGEIEPMELLATIRRIEKRGALETAHRVLNTCSRVFRYAVASGLAKSDPASDLRGALPPYRKNNHFATITDPKTIGDLLRDIEQYQGTIVVRCAFALSMHLFLRPGELRKLQWDWIDLDESLLTIPASEHKTGKKTHEPHLVPLSKQAILIIKEIEPVTGSGRYLFPSERDKDRPLSDNGVRSAMRRLGWSNEEMTPHGIRAMASTLLDNMGYESRWIERQLAHDEQNKVKAAYKRHMHLMYLPERKKMMQDWSDYLDGLRDVAMKV